MSQSIHSSPDNCACCRQNPQPAPVSNRPGLPALSYRIGTYADFFRHMLSRLTTHFLPKEDGIPLTRPLAELKTRELDDPAIALLDAGAVVADVLTFYQERIANEGFVRTATERRSILELARAIGYELRPGVAASAYLAFTVDETRGAPQEVEIPAGIKVQSVPPQDKLPQMFETSQAITARAEWNALRPRLSYKQVVTKDSRFVYLHGSTSNLKPGDRLLIDDGQGDPNLVRVSKVEPIEGKKRVEGTEVPSGETIIQVELDGTKEPSQEGASLPMEQLVSQPQIPIDGKNFRELLLRRNVSDSDLRAFIASMKLDPADLLKYFSTRRKQTVDSSGKVYAMRASAGFFGCNAPRFDGLPKNSGGETIYPKPSWDVDWKIWMDQSQVTADPLTADPYYVNADIYLERIVQGIVPGSWLCIEVNSPPDGIRSYYTIDKVMEQSLAEFALSGRATGLILKNRDGLLDDKPEDKPADYTIKNATAYLKSEELALVEIPVSKKLAGGQNVLELDGFVLGLNIGQVVILTGELDDEPGVVKSEAFTIKDIRHSGGFTILTFETGLQYSYKPLTVFLNANVAPATHGETVTEILGNGEGAKSNQKFTLKKPPLTHVPAATPSGSISTLKLRVNGLLWEERSSLYGSTRNDERYTVRIDDDAKATLTFGDGKQGARLPTGVNNLVATYRSGIGLDGQVEAGSLTILQSRPLGLHGVSNPLPASGAGDPEKMDHARINAPCTVRTLDRIVSRNDYEDFARTFAGIGKARGIDLWSGERHVVHLTIAGEDEQPVTDANFMKNFLNALDAARDPTQVVRVDTYDQLFFNVMANVIVDRRYVSGQVLSQAQSALIEKFCFDSREFGQSVNAAEIVAALQNVDGVICIDLDSLYLSGEDEALNQILPAFDAGESSNGLQRAQLLLIHPQGIILREVTP